MMEISIPLIILFSFFVKEINNFIEKWGIFKRKRLVY